MQLAVLCVIVFVQFCYITATPHGYGVKGGALAKADASAAAGAFSDLGPLPLGVPIAPGFSGSYSKSSSSSSSSSSASSSSSSFSYSGSGIPSVAGGCSTGACQNSGSNDKNYHGQNGGTGSTSGNQNINYNQGFPASAGAAGQAGGPVSTGQNFRNPNNPSCTGNNCSQKECKGSDCNSVPALGSKCESGRCEHVPFSHSSPSSFDNNDNGCISGKCDTSVEQGSIPTSNVDSASKCQSGHCETTQKCTSGNCGPSTVGNDKSSHTEETPKITTPNSDTNPIKATPDYEDINVNLAKNTNSKTNSNYNNNNHDKAAANFGSPTNCAFGNCASNPPLSTSHGAYPYSTHNTDTSNCNSPNCKKDVYSHAAAAGGIAVPGSFKPETHLTVPKLEPTCVSPHCKTTDIHSGYHPSDSVIPVPVSQPNLPNDNKKQFDCVRGQCGNNQPNSYVNPSHSINPIVNSPISGFGSSGNKCTASDCTSTPLNPSHLSSHNYNSDHTPGAPKQDEPYPSFVPLSPTKSHPCSGSSCTGGLTISSNPPIAPLSHAHQPSNTNKPTHESLDKPYTGGFGGPPGLLKPNDYSLPHPIPHTKPITSQQPSVTCSTGNCHSASNDGHIINHGNSNAGSVVGSFGGPPGLLKPHDYNFPNSAPVNKPVVGQQPSTPCSSENCHSAPSQGQLNNSGNLNAGSVVSSIGGPSGILKPNDYNLPHSKPHDKPISGQQLPVTCSTGDCHSAPNEEQHYNSGSSSAASVVGGFGGPPGILKPNDYNLPHSKPHGKPISGQQLPVTCSTGNCHSAPNEEQLYNSGSSSAGSVVGGFGGPPGLLKPNDYNLPHSKPHDKPISGQQPPAPCLAGNCHSASSQGQIYNNGNSYAGSTVGGFGGPPGLLKPNDYNLPNSVLLTKPPAIQHPSSVPCSGGNCHNVPSQGQHYNGGNSNAGSVAGGFGGSPGFLKPNDHYFPSSVSLNKPTAGQQPTAPCSTGNCHSAHNQGQLNTNGNSNVASTVTSFGGPPGLLKPNDYTLGNAESHNKPVAGQHHALSCTTGNCGNVAGLGLINNGNSNKISTTHDTTACASGNCGLHGNSAHILNGAHSSASAAASANAAVYTGGFGGPPGFLKPYDDGNVKAALATLGGKLTHANAAPGGIISNGPHSNLNTGAGSIAQSFAAAGTTAGLLSGHPGHYNHDVDAEHKSGRGCSGGCSASDNGLQSGGLNSYLNGGFAGLSAAKAGAISGANAGSIGFGGSFASSSASAHASAGAAVKGYGRR